MTAAPSRPTMSVSLVDLLHPAVQADPYPLYRKLREQAPVYWDPYLHAWVVTRYQDVVEVLLRFRAGRTPTPERLTELGLGRLAPIARMMVRQMLFLDPPAHGRVRSLAAAAFTPRRIAQLQEHIQAVTDSLLDALLPSGRMDVMADLADQLPAIITAELLGVPAADHARLKAWSLDFAEMLGNFQHNPDRASRALRSLEEMTEYFSDAVERAVRGERQGLIAAMATAGGEDDRLGHEELLANIIITMTGGQETTTNLIGNGLLTLLRHPDQMQQLQAEPSLLPSAIEELLRYDSPIQQTARLAPHDLVLGGQQIRESQAVIAVLGAANRDPDRFAAPDTLDLNRPDNRHVAFGWAAHFCFGAPLARLEGRIVLDTVLRRLHELRLEPGPLRWRPNLTMRGLAALPVAFRARRGD